VGSRSSVYYKKDKTMKLITSFLCLLTFAVVQLFGCQKSAPFDPALAGSFFPLRPGSSWTYRVIDKGQNTTEVFTDRAVGQERIGPAGAASEVVSEYSGSNGKGKSTIFYVVEDGYVSRVFGLGDRSQILFQERGFLPRLLKPDLTWSNSLFPFGRLPEGFYVIQNHRTSLEAGVVLVPAGHFSNCIRIETEAVYSDSSSKQVRKLRYLDWYAPNVGLVKTLVLKSGFFGSETARVELLSFVDSQVKAASHRSLAESSNDTTVP
jgi:hypothetical protein